MDYQYWLYSIRFIIDLFLNIQKSKKLQGDSNWYNIGLLILKTPSPLFYNEKKRKQNYEPNARHHPYLSVGLEITESNCFKTVRRYIKWLGPSKRSSWWVHQTDLNHGSRRNSSFHMRLEWNCLQVVNTQMQLDVLFHSKDQVRKRYKYVCYLPDFKHFALAWQALLQFIPIRAVCSHLLFRLHSPHNLLHQNKKTKKNSVLRKMNI